MPSVEASNNKVKLVVTTYSKANGVIVNVGFKTPNVNWYVMRKLHRGEPCECPTLAHGSEASALAYALFQHVQDKLVGNPQAMAKNKATNVCCSYQNGELTLHIACQGTVSVVNRILSETSRALTPEKVFPRYQANIRMLNGSPKRDEFNACVNQMAPGMAKISVLVVGKVNLGKGKKIKERMTKLTGTVNKKLNKVSKQTPANKPASLKEKKNETQYPTLSVSGPAVVYVCDYLSSVLKIPIAVNSNKIIVYDKNIKNKLAALRAPKRVSAYVKKYSKVKDLNAVLAYLASANCNINVSTLISIAKGNSTLSKIESDIKSSLK